MKYELSDSDMKKLIDKKVIRRFKDMKNSWKNPGGIKGNPLIYSVYIRDFGQFEYGLTIIEPGAINKEFFMTKGHRHNIGVKEMYILQKGKGKLLLQNPDAKTNLIELKKAKTYVIPGTFGHRLINTGKQRLEVLTIYSKRAGHDYKFKFKRHILKNK